MLSSSSVPFIDVNAPVDDDPVCEEEGEEEEEDGDNPCGISSSSSISMSPFSGASSDVSSLISDVVEAFDKNERLGFDIFSEQWRRKLFTMVGEMRKEE
jgi:hypothetical protein